jgi:histidinol dehydrogenase
MLRIISENIDKELQKLLDRSSCSLERPEAKAVQEIISNIRKNGDQALRQYTKKFDGACPAKFKVDPVEIKLAHQQADKNFLKAVRTAIKNISQYHLRQVPKSWLIEAGETSAVGLRYSPVGTAGIYVPGGRAVYPSSFLMNVIPAKIAGVPRICVVTPPDSDGKAHRSLLAVAYEVGIEEIYLCGGAQAIAALAYGTESIPRADFIAGPGNIYMTLAKKIVYGDVGIDKLAGPSESLILADKTADPAFVAADLITQAEHDPLAVSLLICDEAKLAQAVNKELDAQVKKLKRQKIITDSFTRNGAIILIKDRKDFVRLTDMIAPEHLELMLKNNEELLNDINNAGAIFIGAYSPESLGDYLAGPNHVLPTGGAARFSSPLGVEDFLKKTSLIHYTKKALKAVQKDIAVFAETEGLDGHAAAVNIRFAK